MTYQLYPGNCLEVMPILPAQSVDAIICDPPYGTTSCAWDSVIPFAPMWECIRHVIKPRGAVVLFGSQPFTSALVMSNVEWFKQEIIWDKVAPVGFLNARRYVLSKHENMLLFCQGQPTYNPQDLMRSAIKSSRENGKTKKGGVYGGVKDGLYINEETNFPTSILSFPRVTNGQIHSTQKPVDLMAYLIRTYTNPGQTVLDFTFGSCSTGVACLETGRNFIGIEMDSEYFQVASRRLETIYGRLHGLARKANDTSEDLPLFMEQPI